MVGINHIKDFYVSKLEGFFSDIYDLPFEKFYFNKRSYMRKVLAARNIIFAHPAFECPCSLELENFGLKYSEAIRSRVPASSKLFAYYMFI